MSRTHRHLLPPAWKMALWSLIEMRAFERRLNKLEERFGVSSPALRRFP